MQRPNKEHQRLYKEKMYKAGLKSLCFWVKRKETKNVKMTQIHFLQNLNKLTKGWNAEQMSDLYNLFIKIIKGKKEADKHKTK